jgi:hypothetical protein
MTLQLQAATAEGVENNLCLVEVLVKLVEVFDDPAGNLLPTSAHGCQEERHGPLRDGSLVLSVDEPNQIQTRYLH